VEEIAGEYFSTDTINVSLVGEPNFTGNGIRQQNETDLAFLLRLAERYGCEMFVLSEEDDSSLNFIAQHQIMNQVPDVTLYHGRCGAPARLLSFRATSDVGDIQLPRTLSGIDGDTGELLEAETSEISETQETEDAFRDENLTAFVNEETERNTAINELAGAAGTVQDALRERLGTVRMEPTQGFLTQEELSVRAENQFSTSLHGMRGNGTAEGNHRVQAQTTIGIADVGGRFSNIWYLSEVRHIIDRNGYKTEFDCKR
jgi:phage protein D